MRPSIAVEDRLALEELLYRYAWASDDQQFTGVRDCFTDDGVMIVRYPNGNEVRVEKSERIAEWVRHGRMALGPEMLKRHVTSCFVLDACEGGRAFATAYFCVLHARPGQPPFPAAVGRYEDHFRHTDDGWRFESRLIVVEAQGHAPSIGRARD